MPVIDMELTGRNIERLRKENNMTVRDLQECFGFETPQAIYKWQRGVALPTIDNLLYLAMLFGVRIEDILIVKKFFNFMSCLALQTGIYFATPNKFNKTHPVIINATDTIPTILSFSPNNTAEIIVDATIPTALHVAYATPRLMEFSAFENRRKHTKYATKQPRVR